MRAGIRPMFAGLSRTTRAEWPLSRSTMGRVASNPDVLRSRESPGRRWCGCAQRCDAHWRVVEKGRRRTWRIGRSFPEAPCALRETMA